ncbi:glycosyltransferase [Lysinibacillus sp. Ag94]|uniref:glycosyltransferase n=1 Tax=Lysinibacillus sp. Ag94 TaxID=2936682 RepID=UPI00200C0BCF|nr:glycosyltransferase [Lysinibacillus sp. Ag94]UPW83769.1 glycosyltransferase [Lysinibacillus sp. Ag94]
MKRIIFFYPTEEVNGVANQFIWLAKYLQKKGYDVSLIDSKEGYIKNELIASNIEVIEYSYPNKIYLHEECILVAPASHIHRVPLEFEIPEEKKVKLIFWSLHPHNLVWEYGIWGFIKSFKPFEMKEILTKIFPETFENYTQLINTLYHHNSLYFMDQSNFDFPKQVYNICLECEKYIPIAVKNSSYKAKALKIVEIKNYAWVGRLSDDKVYSLIKVLNDVDQYAKEKNKEINFYIIGSGSYEFLLKKELESKKWNINIVNLGTLKNNDLSQFLFEKIDLLFAMGTSCLEAAKLGIPTVLVNASNSRVELMEYKWLYETKNYSLGSFVELQNNVKYSSIDELKLEKIKIHSEKCFEYVNKYHTIGQVATMFEEIFDKELFTLSDLRVFIEHSPLNFNNFASNLIVRGYYMNDANNLYLSNILKDIEKEFLEKKLKKLLIWGVGSHSKALLKFYDFANMELKGFTDSSDSIGEFLNYPKYSVDDIGDLDIDVILISSLTYEKKIYDKFYKKMLSRGIIMYPIYKANEGIVATAIWNQVSSEIYLCDEEGR